MSTAGQAIGPGWRRIGLGLSVCLPGWDNSAHLVAWLQIRLGRFFFSFLFAWGSGLHARISVIGSVEGGSPRL